MRDCCFVAQGVKHANLPSANPVCFLFFSVIVLKGRKSRGHSKRSGDGSPPTIGIETRRLAPVTGSGLAAKRVDRRLILGRPQHHFAFGEKKKNYLPFHPKDGYIFRSILPRRAREAGLGGRKGPPCTKICMKGGSFLENSRCREIKAEVMRLALIIGRNCYLISSSPP